MLVTSPGATRYPFSSGKNSSFGFVTSTTAPYDSEKSPKYSLASMFKSSRKPVTRRVEKFLKKLKYILNLLLQNDRCVTFVRNSVFERC